MGSIKSGGENGYIHKVLKFSLFKVFYDLITLGRRGFENPVLDVEHCCLTYPDVRALARDLKSIGAGNAAAGRPRGLCGRAGWSALAAAYEGFRSDGRLPATFEVVHAHAWKPLHTWRLDADGAQPLRFHPRRVRPS